MSYKNKSFMSYKSLDDCVEKEILQEKRRKKKWKFIKMND
jgi:hypothetical protein